MKKILTLVGLLFLLGNIAFAQSDTSVYKNLKIVKQISKDDIDKCRPCLVEYYYKNGNIKSRVVQYGDCCVGKFIDYYPNGQVKLRGSCKENDTGNWENIWARGYCGQRHGELTYYNKNGTIAYQEFWNDGQFLRQVPQQSNVEIWDVALMLDTNRVDTFAKAVNITLEDFQNLSIQPLFKNSNQNANLFIEIIVIARKEHYHLGSFTKKFNTRTLQGENIGLLEFLEKHKEKTSLQVSMMVYWDNNFIDSFSFNLAE